jgi:glycosyltransferase involved in cell wall biosynthesis
VGRRYDAQAHSFRRHPAVARLHFGHHVEPVAIVPFIRSADVGLVLYEPCSENYRCALPNGFFQTIAARLPLVRMPLSEIEAAIAGSAVGVCLERADPRALARAILRCTEDQKTFRRNATVLSQQLRWELEARRLQRLVENVLGCSAQQSSVTLTATADD